MDNATTPSTATVPVPRHLPKFEPGSACFLRGPDKKVRAYRVISLTRNHLNERCYNIHGRGLSMTIRDSDPSLLTGFEPDFPPNHEIDWRVYREPEKMSLEELEGEDEVAERDRWFGEDWEAEDLVNRADELEVQHKAKESEVLQLSFLEI
jgi:hypothetical protein